MLKNTHFKKFLGPALILVAGLSFSSLHAKPSITDLTSSETAQKAQSGEIKESRFGVTGLNPINTHSLGVGIGQTFLKSDFSFTSNCLACNRASRFWLIKTKSAD